MTYDVFGFAIPAFLFWKVIGLCVLAFVVNFLYTLWTGRNLTDDRNRMRQAKEQRGSPVSLSKTDQESR